MEIKYFLFKEVNVFYNNWKKVPTSDRNASLQLSNNIKAPEVGNIEFTRVLLQFVLNNILDSINQKDKDLFISKEIPPFDIAVKLTNNSYSLNNGSKIISYKSIYVNYNGVKLVIANLNALFQITQALKIVLTYNTIVSVQFVFKI